MLAKPDSAWPRFVSEQTDLLHLDPAVAGRMLALIRLWQLTCGEWTPSLLERFADAGVAKTTMVAGSAARSHRLVIEDDRGRTVYEASRALGMKTNNEAEYLALIAALEYLKDARASEAEFLLDSELVVRQLSGEYKVNIIGLSQKTHHFDFDLSDGFFAKYGKKLLESGHFDAKITLDKRETLIEGHFHIEGIAHLTCDRSLEPFDYPLTIDQLIVFKYGEEEKELSDDIILITRDRASLDIGQYLYELIGVALPMKRLHPKFKKDNLEESEIQLVYSTPIDENKNEEDAIDPRWEKLKKLK